MTRFSRTRQVVGAAGPRASRPPARDKEWLQLVAELGNADLPDSFGRHDGQGLTATEWSSRLRCGVRSKNGGEAALKEPRCQGLLRMFELAVRGSLKL